MNIIEQIRNRKIAIAVLVILTISIPITVFIARKQQEIRTRAGGGSVQFQLVPKSLSKMPGEIFSVDVSIDAGTFLLSGLDTNISIDKNIVDFVSFNPASTFDQIIINNYSLSTGILRITAVDVDRPASTGIVKIGTLTLKAKSVGTGQVNFLNSQTVGLGQDTSLPVNAPLNGLYTIALPTPTPTPTRVPTPSPTKIPTLTPKPTVTPAPTKKPSPTPTKIITPTPTKTPTPSPTRIPTPTPTKKPTPTPTKKPTPVIHKVTLNPVSDSFVRSTVANANFGTITKLETDSSPVEISYMKFNLSSLFGKTIKSAKLRLKVSDPTNQTLNLRRATTVRWLETGITYNNRPGFEALIRTFNANSVNSVVELDVKSVVNLRKGGEITLGITSGGDDSGAFYSREALNSANRPQLVIEYQ